MKKKSDTHVYYNKRRRGSTVGKYKTGNFISEKNNSTFVYRSAYEYAYLLKLEADVSVVNYIVEPFNIAYFDGKRKRSYKPDIVVLRVNGSIEVIEIKPKAMLMNEIVQRKAAAARSFIKRNFKNATVEYKFITEEDIFSNSKEYAEILKTI
jgi:hypothetical protein